jgi:hypothetical protein
MLLIERVERFGKERLQAGNLDVIELLLRQATRENLFHF